MPRETDPVWLAGVDGCPDRWIAAFVRPTGSEVRFRRYDKFQDLLDCEMNPAKIAVDIPIGLPERAVAGGRCAEREVRERIGARRSSVFSVPSRDAVYEVLETPRGMAPILAAHQRACRAALRSSDPPKSISLQSFMLFPKIREVDGVLSNEMTTRCRVFESHPELAFWHLNDNNPLKFPKKRKGRPFAEGMAERISLLSRAGLATDGIKPRAFAQVGIDDMVDALACAAVARRLHDGVAKSYPDPPPCDRFGLRMAIWV